MASLAVLVATQPMASCPVVAGERIPLPPGWGKVRPKSRARRPQGGGKRTPELRKMLRRPQGGGKRKPELRKMLRRPQGGGRRTPELRKMLRRPQGGGKRTAVLRKKIRRPLSGGALTAICWCRRPAVCCSALPPAKGCTTHTD